MKLTQKLSLQKETLKSLTESQTREVAGLGAARHHAGSSAASPAPPGWWST
jgi:hypothetical protein